MPAPKGKSVLRSTLAVRRFNKNLLEQLTSAASVTCSR